MYLAWKNKQWKKKLKCTISLIEGAAAFVSKITKAIPVKSVCWAQTDAFSEAEHLQSASSHQCRGYWMDGSKELAQSLTEVSAQSGWPVVDSELDEGVQEVAVQIGELLTRADLF